VPSLDILTGVEDREVLADDLFGLVALDALGPRFQVVTRPSTSSMKMA
jgi:hypothetical protein